MKPVPFRIDTTCQTIEVDGRDLAEVYPVQRVAFELNADRSARLLIELVPGAGVLEGECLPTLIVPGPPSDQREAVLAFLGNLDASSLEQAALARGGAFTEEETTGQAFLGALKEMAGGN